MKIRLTLSLLLVSLFSAFPALADDPAGAEVKDNPPAGTLAPHPSMKENTDGELRQGEYEVISMNGGVTRAFCPYTCEMRGLPKQHCRTWQSLQDKTKCYVEDTRIPSQAIPIGK